MAKGYHERLTGAARALGVWSLLLGLVSCELLSDLSRPPAEAAPSATGPPPPEPILPSAPKPRGAELPSWAVRLPPAPIRCRPGDRVWATPPERGRDLTQTAIYTVEEVSADGVTLIDLMGQKVVAVPAAVIHPSGRATRFAVGDLALGSSWTTPAILARVIVIDKHGRPTAVQYDWSGKTVRGELDHVQRPVQGIKPLAFVGYPKLGEMSLGLVVAMTSEQAWIRTDSGQVEIHPLGSLKPLAISAKKRKVGDKVLAYRWATGFRPGVIAEISEPGLRYLVKLADAPSEPFFFTRLISDQGAEKGK